MIGVGYIRTGVSGISPITDLKIPSFCPEILHTGSLLVLSQDYPGAQMEDDLSKTIDRTRVWLGADWTDALL